jgi:4-diphosphocytidyl-2-C-methyl-D-erythritol kinase
MDAVPSFPSLGAQVAWLRGQRNDLQPPAIDLCPNVDEALIALDAAGALLARMSGSGATCFGIFASKAAAERAAAAITRQDWWVVAAEVL